MYVYTVILITLLMLILILMLCIVIVIVSVNVHVIVIVLLLLLLIILVRWSASWPEQISKLQMHRRRSNRCGANHGNGNYVLKKYARGKVLRAPWPKVTSVTTTSTNTNNNDDDNAHTNGSIIREAPPSLPEIKCQRSASVYLITC